jgi:hypothetical protein
MGVKGEAPEAGKADTDGVYWLGRFLVFTFIDNFRS